MTISLLIFFSTTLQKLKNYEKFHSWIHSRNHTLRMFSNFVVQLCPLGQIKDKKRLFALTNLVLSVSSSLRLIKDAGLLSSREIKQELKRDHLFTWLELVLCSAREVKIVAVWRIDFTLKLLKWEGVWQQKPEKTKLRGWGSFWWNGEGFWSGNKKGGTFRNASH